MVITRSQARKMSSSNKTGTMANGNPFTIRKFDGKNFVIWKSQIVAYMRVKECYDAVTQSKPVEAFLSGDKEAKKKAVQEWDDKNNLALGIILLALCDEQAILVCHMTSAKEAWERLLQAYEQSSQGSRVALQMQFCNCSMRQGERVIDYVSRVQRIYLQLKQAGAILDEEALVGRIVGGLTSDYHVFMTNWSNNVGLRQSMAELVPRLTAEELIVNRVRKSESTALFVERKNKGPKQGQSQGHLTSGPMQQGQDKSRAQGQSSRQPRNDDANNQSKPRRTCYSCGKPGHIKKYCRSRQAQPQAESSNTERGEQTVIAEGIIAEANAAQVSEKFWIVDSGASDHMSFDRESFDTYEVLDNPAEVKMGDHGCVKCIGKGTVNLIASVEGREQALVLHDVLHVPAIRRKLISIGAATSRGKTGEIQPDRIVLKNPAGNPILIAVKHNKLYRALAVESHSQVSCCELSNVEGVADDNAKLWHERLAHVSQTTIAKMKKVEAVKGLERYEQVQNAKSSDQRVISCESCCIGKQSRLTFPNSTRPRAETVGRFVHMDICGPVGTTSLSGAKYFILFKDEFSNFRFIYFMRSREEAFDCIRKTVMKIKVDTGNNVKCLVSDLGSEFTSNRTQKYLLDNNIDHKTSTAFTPQQNGLIERDNRTVMEATRAMLFNKKLPEFLWAEAANTAIYILNRVINKSTGELTPFELYYGEKPTVEHLVIFGSVGFVKAQEKKRSGYQRKLDPRAFKTILVGYELGPHRQNTYRLYDPESRKIIVSREVKFDEKMISPLSGDHSYESIDGVLSNGDSIPVVEDEDKAEGNFASSLDEEPRSYREALRSPDAAEWRKAMADELESLVKNKTWLVCKCPPGKRPIGCRWVYKIKRNLDGSIARYKARLVAQGFTQREGIDYSETYAPVVRLESVRLILSLIAKLDLDVVHFDIKTAFLHGHLDEEIFMREPEGFGTGRVCKLQKSLYGLKQASRAWNSTFVTFLREFRLEPIHADSCVLISRDRDQLLLVAIWVDDGLACSSDSKLLERMIMHLERRFEITKMEPKCFVGLEITRDRARKVLSVSQSAYVSRLLVRFGASNESPHNVPLQPKTAFVRDGVFGGPKSDATASPYRELVGCLMYLAVGSRPDISYAVATLARFCNEPKTPHWLAARGVLRYLKGTPNMCICYDGSMVSDPVVYTDASYGDCRDTRKSMMGILVKCCGAPVVWRAQKQATVAESTTEAEFVACSSGSREAVWLRQFLGELGLPLTRPTVVYCDNDGAIQLVRNNQIHSKIKHLDIRHMAIREREQAGLVTVKRVDTNEQEADILTKALVFPKFSYLRQKMGLLLVSVLLLLATSSDALKLKIGRNFSQEPSRRVTLKINDPCPTAVKVEEEMRGTIEAKSGWDVNTTAIAMTRTICKNIIETQVKKAVFELAECDPKGRVKRDLGAIASLASSAATIIVGVSNLIRGGSEIATPATKQDTIANLDSQVDAATRATLQDPTYMIAEESKELAIVSETADSHQLALLEEIEQIPMLVWSTFHVVHELYAGVADLKAIRKQCKRGKLATQELGEMLENQELRELDAEDTQLIGIQVNTGASSIEFLYKPERTFEIEPEHLGLAIMGLFLFFMALCLCIMNMETIKRLRKPNNTVAVRNSFALEL